MFLHETAESRKVCGYTGNAHHSTFSCQKKQTKSISGQYALNGFTLSGKKKKKQADRRSHNTRAALKMLGENYYAKTIKKDLEKKKEKEILKKISHCFCEHICVSQQLN